MVPVGLPAPSLGLLHRHFLLLSPPPRPRCQSRLRCVLCHLSGGSEGYSCDGDVRPSEPRSPARPVFFFGAGETTRGTLSLHFRGLSRHALDHWTPKNLPKSRPLGFPRAHELPPEQACLEASRTPASTSQTSPVSTVSCPGAVQAQPSRHMRTEGGVTWLSPNHRCVSSPLALGRKLLLPVPPNRGGE